MESHIYKAVHRDSLDDVTFIGAEKGTDFSFIPPSRSEKTSRRLKIFLLSQGVLNLTLIWLCAWLFVSRHLAGQTVNTQFLYSPAQDALEYETRVFHESFGKDISIYQQPPSPEVDKAWDELYNFGVTKIPKSIASNLVNKTYRIPGDEEHYVIELDVFHELHCLNMLRKALYPEYYPPIKVFASPTENHLFGVMHRGHCIESIRQSLMCSVDISPIVWQWVDRVQEVRVVGNIIHTCRSFDKVRDWALKRRLTHELNFEGFH